MEQPSELLRSPQMESAADGTSLQPPDSVRIYTGVISIVRAMRTFGQNYLDVCLGAVLILAGALKGQQLLTDPSAGRATGFPRELLIGASAFELAFGCWLLAGLYRHLTRWLALAWFSSLATVALAQARGGAPTCACLGNLHASPWIMFAFDVAAVGALWPWSPNDRSCQRHFPITLCLSLLPAVALFGLVSAPRGQTLFAEIDLGDIVQGGQIQHAFQIRNDSRALVEVAAIKTSCPCANIRLEHANVPASQFLAGNVILDLRQKPDYTGDLAIEAKGVTGRGRIAFVLLILSRVQPRFENEE